MEQCKTLKADHLHAFAGCDNRHERLQRLAVCLRLLPAPTRCRGFAAHAGRFRVAFSSDIAMCITAIVARGPRFPVEDFNVASGVPMTIDEYYAAICDQLGSDGGSLVRLRDRPELCNYERQGILDTTKAEQLLAFVPTPVSVFLAETITWHAQLLE